PADASFVAWPGKTFKTHIVEISPVVSNVTRTISLKLEFDEKHPELRAGMFASIKLVTETKKNVILVPSVCVVTRGEGKYVFIAQDNKAVMTLVSVGLDVDGVAEIIAGLAEDAEIVLRGQNLLDDGVDINVINKENPDGGKN
ncbi:MAG: efflux RND transporter periplasmic adaptor subunit, partial [Spirochaetaceae bacterium]|nr:efflux RND transporter periplasmic adaptor subunit [Spirochaetaceae bacterium]